MALPEHLRRGARGEQLAARFLRDRGFQIVGATFLTKVGATDIIALSADHILCFVEVKTRAPGGMFPPADAVDREKQERLISNALTFAKHSKEDFERIRFDIAEVVLHDLLHADINLIENAFGQEYHAKWRKRKEPER